MIQKRVLDITISLALLPVGVVLCATLGLLILLVHRENPLFLQTRVGLHGENFTLFKLRTMRASTANVPTHKISRADISTLGRFLRATKIDELPQLYNVLVGDMSLVGPRPCLPTQDLLINERRKRSVLDVKPGITGYAQVKGIDMCSPVLLACEDQFYVKNQTVKLDLLLLLQTVFGHGCGDRTVTADRV